MSIIHYSIFIFFIFNGFLAKSQEIKDTIVDGRSFAIHIVEAQESLHDIARKYNSEINEIVVSNPSIIQGLKKGFRLFIPIQGLNNNRHQKLNNSNTINEKSSQIIDKSILKMALLLPFYLDINDTLEKHNQSRHPTSIYSKSKIALDYYFGVVLALDTISDLGYHIDMQVFDVSNDSIYKELLKSSVLDDRQLILGPLHINQFNKLSQRYGRDLNKILVSPLSYKNAINKYSNTYQVVPFAEIQLKDIINWIKSKHFDDPIVIIGREEDKKMINYSKRKLLSIPDQLRHQDYIFKSGNIPEKKILYSVLNQKKNIVLIPSNDRSFVSRILPMLGSMKDTVFSIYGLESWNRFDNLDMDDLVNLDVHVPSLFFQYPEDLYQDFVISYYANFKGFPSKYSFAAYKQMLFFITEEFSDLYSFDKVAGYSGRLNTAYPFIKYQDYKQHIVK